MAQKRVTITARVKAKQGMEEKVRQELVSLVTLTRSEAGCINYDLHQSLDDKSLFLFYENWASKADLDRHLETPHLNAWMKKAEELTAGPPEITLWEMVD